MTSRCALGCAQRGRYSKPAAVVGSPRCSWAVVIRERVIARLQVVYGELSDAVLDQLSALSQGVFLPLISNNNVANCSTPEVVVKNIVNSMHKFVASGGSSMVRLVGKSRG